MTEIEKMYENANVYEMICMYDCRMEYGDVCGYAESKIKEPCKVCEKAKQKIKYYPDFTAEKQLKIIQLLSKIRNAIQLCYSDNQYIFVVNFETEKCQWANKYHEKIDEALADMVNVLWQILTDQEKEEIKRILNE